MVAGQLLALGHLPSLAEAALGFLTGFFISGALMITNDYFDLEVDRVNHPGRPLPSGRITVAELVILTILFTVAGLATAASLGLLALLIAAGIWAIGILYNWKFKEAGLPGNMMVGLSVAMTFVAGGVSVGQAANGVVWIFGACAFIFDLAEEIAGGAMDIEGDKLRSARTLGAVKGRKFALRVSGLLYAVFVVLTFLPYALGWLGLTYLVLVRQRRGRGGQRRRRGRRPVYGKHKTYRCCAIAHVYCFARIDTLDCNFILARSHQAEQERPPAVILIAGSLRINTIRVCHRAGLPELPVQPQGHIRTSDRFYVLIHHEATDYIARHRSHCEC